jgi:hypothetical protein
MPFWRAPQAPTGAQRSLIDADLHLRWKIELVSSRRFGGPDNSIYQSFDGYRLGLLIGPASFLCPNLT